MAPASCTLLAYVLFLSSSHNCKSLLACLQPLIALRLHSAKAIIYNLFHLLSLALKPLLVVNCFGGIRSKPLSAAQKTFQNVALTCQTTLTPDHTSLLHSSRHCPAQASLSCLGKCCFFCQECPSALANFPNSDLILSPSDGQGHLATVHGAVNSWTRQSN